MEYSFEASHDLVSVQETLRGNRNAFASIVNRYTPQLYSLAYRMLGNQEEAEEAVQEIFLRTYRALGRFQLNRRFHPWLYTIALNYLRGRLRRGGRGGARSHLSFDEKLVDARVSKPRDATAIALEREQAEQEAQRALERLHPKYREVFVLRQIEGLPVRDVAEILGIPEGTVKTNLHRARAALIDELADRGWT